MNMAYAEDFVRNYLKNNKSIQPMFIGTKINGDQIIFTGEWDDDDEKRFFLTGVKCAFGVNDVHCYVVFSEAWAASFKEDEKHTRPSECADKEEVLLLSGVDYSEKVMKIFPIVRDGKGKFLELGENQIEDEEANFEGAFTELLFEPGDMNQEQKKWGEKFFKEFGRESEGFYKMSETQN